MVRRLACKFLSDSIFNDDPIFMHWANGSSEMKQNYVKEIDLNGIFFINAQKIRIDQIR